MKIEAINELKGIAILLVIIYHVGGILNWTNVIHGEIGVDIFVVLSGIGLALGYPSIKNKWQFLFKRLRKIMPLYWIVLTCFALGEVYILHKGFDSKDFIYHALGIHAYANESYIYGYSDSFWYLSLILLLYIVYIPTSRFVESEKPQHVITIGFALTFVLTIYFYVFNPNYSSFVHLVIRVPEFFFAVVFGMYLKKPDTKFVFTIPFTLSLSVFMFLILHKGYPYIYSIAGVSFVLFYFQLSKWLEQYYYLRKIKTLFLFFGSISYELFLVHQPLIGEYSQYLIAKLHWNPTPHRVEFGMLIMFGIAIILSLFLKKMFTLTSSKITIHTKSN
jgi:peptidoglycan/LPS O-acetylase OafA/YrhL